MIQLLNLRENIHIGKKYTGSGQINKCCAPAGYMNKDALYCWFAI